MKRRHFITLLGAAATAWPIAARGQQPAMPAIGFLGSSSFSERPHLIAAFLQSLNEGGYIEGRNVTIEYRSAEGRYDRLPALAAELVGRHVAVIVASGSPDAARAAKAATATIPIVFATGGDPIGLGLVASLNRPDSNATGVSLFNVALVPKQLELLHELVPKAAVIAVLVNPDNVNTEVELREVQAAARALSLQVHVLRASAESDFDLAFATLVQQRAGALIVSYDSFFFGRRDQLVALAARHMLPSIYHWREFAVSGGLISYGTSLADAYRQMGNYVGRILKGAKAGDLPVMQPRKFELVINLKTAKTLGLTVPLIMQMTADEVIE